MAEFSRLFKSISSVFRGLYSFDIFAKESAIASACAEFGPAHHTILGLPNDKAARRGKNSLQSSYYQKVSNP